VRRDHLSRVRVDERDAALVLLRDDEQRAHREMSVSPTKSALSPGASRVPYVAT